MNPRYPAVAQRAAHRCEYCLAPEAVFNFRHHWQIAERTGNRRLFANEFATTDDGASALDSAGNLSMTEFNAYLTKH